MIPHFQKKYMYFNGYNHMPLGSLGVKSKPPFIPLVCPDYCGSLFSNDIHSPFGSSLFGHTSAFWSVLLQFPVKISGSLYFQFLVLFISVNALISVNKQMYYHAIACSVLMYCFMK